MQRFQNLSGTSALDEARRPAAAPMDPNRPRAAPMLMPRRPGASLANPSPQSFDGVLKAMNQHNGGRIQKPSAGAMMIMNQYRNNGALLSASFQNGGIGGETDSSSVDNIGPIRIRSRVLNKDNSQQAPIIVINSVYNTTTTTPNGQNGGIRVRSNRNLIQSRTTAGSLMLGAGHGHGAAFSGFRQASNRKWYERSNGSNNGGNNRLQRKVHVGLPITGSWKDVNITKDDLDDDLDAYMAKASGGLAKVKLGNCEKVSSNDSTEESPRSVTPVLNPFDMDDMDDYD